MTYFLHPTYYYFVPTGEFESEWAGIWARASEAGVADLYQAIDEFKVHILEGKSDSSHDWRVRGLYNCIASQTSTK